MGTNVQASLKTFNRPKTVLNECLSQNTKGRDWQNFGVCACNLWCTGVARCVCVCVCVCGLYNLWCIGVARCVWCCNKGIRIPNKDRDVAGKGNNWAPGDAQSPGCPNSDNPDWRLKAADNHPHNWSWRMLALSAPTWSSGIIRRRGRCKNESTPKTGGWRQERSVMRMRWSPVTSCEGWMGEREDIPTRGMWEQRGALAGDYSRNWGNMRP